MFDLDTGQVQKDSIGSASLVDLSPSPEGTGRRMKVNSKGQVTELLTEDLVTAPRIFRVILRKDSGVADTASGVDTLRGVIKESRSLKAYWFTEYEWIVPDKVTRINVSMVGGGMGYKENEPDVGDDSFFSRFDWIVEPGERLIIRVGHGMPPQTDPNLHIVAHSSIRSFDGTREVETDAPESDLLQLRMPAPENPYRIFGHGGQATTEYGQDGLVIIEYYA